MKKYLLKRKLINCTCDHCGIIFDKPISEYNRNITLSRKNFCSRNCVGLHNVNVHYDKHGKRSTPKLQSMGRDEFTPFRKYLRAAKARFKEVTITLVNLKQIWEKQGGICPYSGVKLNLKTNKLDRIYNASLDRIDSSLGYTNENIQFVSQSINFMKNEMTHEETILLCRLISDNYFTSKSLIIS